MFNFLNHQDINFYLTQYLYYYPFILPLGIIGLWRWSIWVIKRTSAFFYKPKLGHYQASVSIVTPVYNEDPNWFLKALKSWAENKPLEIIAVIDYTDKNCIEVFKKFSTNKSNAKLIITKIPGKREALATGIKEAKGEILALVDSDTIWTKDTLKNGIIPFSDPKMGGVATKQIVDNPKTFAQKIFAIRLAQRYWDDVPFLAKVGNQIVCLSGRTAFYRREALLPVVDKMVNDFFMGEKVISGEDKKLTYLIEENGWKTTFQSNSVVYTKGEPKLSNFIKQQIRWTRNSWRNDLTALFSGWVFKYPIFAFYLIDRALQPFFLLISPIYFAISLIYQIWISVIIILIWWLVSRLVKIYPYLKQYPKDIVILPFYVLFNFLTAYIRIYSLFSVNTQGWITRWHKERLKNINFVQNFLPHVLSLMVVIFIASVVYTNRYFNFLLPKQKQNKLVSQLLPKSQNNLALANNFSNVLGAATQAPETNITKRYVFKQGDTLQSIANKFDVSLENLLAANITKITNWNKIKEETPLTIPPKNLNLQIDYKFNYQKLYDDPLRIYYDQNLNTIFIDGRGNIVNIKNIYENLQNENILKLSNDGIWDLKANIYIGPGIVFNLDNSNVKWLRLKSDKKSFISIIAYNSDLYINKVKITSWDEEKNDYDKDITDGRSYIMIKDIGTMDIYDSEIAYLGFKRPANFPISPYGISWKMSALKLKKHLLTGHIVNSKFHHNYFGAYTFGATGMLWKNNEFFDNIRYGLDPHDDSNGFLVEENKFYNNGTHGLIFSKRCINNTIRNNISFNNKLHGIMLHELSNFNLIENNEVYENYDGVSFDNSALNIVRSNKIYQNKRGIVLDKKSDQNIIAHNQINNNKQYALYFYDQADRNSIEDNTIKNNPIAIYIKTNNNQILNNNIENNQIGAYFYDNAFQNKLVNNKIIYNEVYGVYSKMISGFTNLVDEKNLVIKNKKNMFVDEIEE
jgi:hyaluronan synthase